MRYEKEQLDLIVQSIRDAKVMQEPKKSVGQIKKAFLLWACIYLGYNILIYFIQQMNLKYQWYLQEDYFLKYDIMIVMLNILMILTLYIFIKKSSIPLVERRFLSVWLIFPILICLNNCASVISPFINIEFMLQYYHAFPLSSIINSISILFVYSYQRSKRIFSFSLISIAYCLLSFLVLASTNWNLTVTPNYLKLLSIIEFFNRYGIIEILTMFFLVANLKEE